GGHGQRGPCGPGRGRLCHRQRGRGRHLESRPAFSTVRVMRSQTQAAKLGILGPSGEANTHLPANHEPQAAPAARETIERYKGENTMKELKFFVCTHCGNLAGMVYSSGVPMICCGEPMKELVPNTVDAAGEKHKPVIS